MENLIFAAQDHALHTKYFDCHIHCGLISLVVVVALTMKLLPTMCLVVQLWQKHHDAIGSHLHWCLCSQFGFSGVKEWWKHNPRTLVESDSVKLLWDFNIITDRTMHVNRPDLILLLKEEQLAHLVTAM